MESFCGIPIVNIQQSRDENLIAKDLVTALSNVGFAYVKYDGFNEEMLKDAFCHSSNFFDLSSDKKSKYIYPTLENKGGFGYVPAEHEHFDHDKPVDIKEAFDISPGVDQSRWPSEEDVPGFHRSMKSLIDQMTTLAHRLYYLVGIGLDLPDPNHLSRASFKGDGMLFRILNYPKVDHLSMLKPGQVRCTGHTDYGFLTILYQDDCGGLEVMNREGEYVEAIPLKGTALVNVGDFLSMCTGEKLKSTMHQVLISEENFGRRRQSIVMFCDPDGDFALEPLCGNLEGLQPLTFNQWRNKRYAQTYR